MSHRPILAFDDSTMTWPNVSDFSHEEAVYDELQKAEGNRKLLPIDEDLPGMGQYCRLHSYFANMTVRDEHFKTKRHEKRNFIKDWRLFLKYLNDAGMGMPENDAGMGMPENGPKLMPMEIYV
ncbi:hypothetical protein CDL12_17467 [Handroanthus impetiginosus]|uniref:Uncharacterized protein n=1 Tax=Handroanthus impetiginosus TaxID=429701 RepID=A0A2G9GXG3_9LAMI|nr:hypothetical protein CDL12_17467 [Handroanthus impetiginosus]